MKSNFIRLMGILFLLSQAAAGQVPTPSGYWALRAGYLRSATHVTNYSPASNFNLVGVGPHNGFYVGGMYQHHWNRLVAYRLELNVQQKGIGNRDFDGHVLFQQPFYYLNLTPMIGLTPFPGLGVFIGPEANWHLGGKGVWNKNATVIETGLSGRIAYRHKWLGLEVGYFKAFNKYKIVSFGPDIRSEFKNYAWQAGLVFVPAMLKRKHGSYFY